MCSHPTRKVFDRLERLAADPLEKLVNNDRAPYALLAAGRVVMFGVRRTSELRSAVVHLSALPSQRDIRLLAAQVTRLQRTVDEIEQLILDAERPLP
jgi:hypothetical protein